VCDRRPQNVAKEMKATQSIGKQRGVFAMRIASAFHPSINQSINHVIRMHIAKMIQEHSICDKWTIGDPKMPKHAIGSKLFPSKN